MRSSVKPAGWLRRAAGLCGLLLALVLLPAAAQLPKLAASAPAAAGAEQAARDPLDRGTPRRAVAAFIRALQRDDMVAALRYVQAGSRPRARTEQLVRELNGLMNRHFHQPLSAISDAPEGALDDGLPLDRERIGPLKIGRQEHSLELVRVTDPVSGPVWLLSSDTLAQVPAMAEEEERSWLQELLPAPFFAPAALGFSFADVAVWAGTLALPLLLLPPLLRLVHLLLRAILRDPAREEALDTWFAELRWPAVLSLLLAFQLSALSWFGPTLGFRIGYGRTVVVLLVLALAWGLHRFLRLAFLRTGARLQDRGRTGVRSMMLLGERLLNVLLLLVAVLVILSLAGFDMGTVLAGLGIVGVALALGAQKTIENILGGMMLLGDEALAVGDLCRINGRLGTVEDITLRSVRFRTLEHTLLSIPAGVLAQADLENFATRDKFLAQHRLRLAYGTSAQQLRRIREEIAALIEANAMLEHPLSRVRVVEFAPLGIELEIYVHVLTRNQPQFLAVREELLLRCVEVVEAAGARFAEPASWAEPPPA